MVGDGSPLLKVIAVIVFGVSSVALIVLFRERNEYWARRPEDLKPSISLKFLWFFHVRTLTEWGLFVGVAGLLCLTSGYGVLAQRFEPTEPPRPASTELVAVLDVQGFEGRDGEMAAKLRALVTRAASRARASVAWRSCPGEDTLDLPTLAARSRARGALRATARFTDTTDRTRDIDPLDALSLSYTMSVTFDVHFVSGSDTITWSDGNDHASQKNRVLTALIERASHEKEDDLQRAMSRFVLAQALNEAPGAP